VLAVHTELRVNVYLRSTKLTITLKPFSVNWIVRLERAGVGIGSESGVSLLLEYVVYATLIVRCFIFLPTAQQRALRLLPNIVLRSS
jgi:hypothetical protein